ncbi:MAG: hypothetical protein ABSC20_09790 [Candidatus Bathyarchaeia archaeon]|jgi:hypothetical protein
MQKRHNLLEIKNTLRQQISEALNEGYMNVEIEIFDMNLNGTYSVKGSFNVVPFLSTTLKRKGTFVTELDENLQIVSLKLTEDKQQ